MGKTETEYKWEKELLDLKHKYKMEEIEGERKNLHLQHDLQLEVIRIKSAEIKRTRGFLPYKNEGSNIRQG